MPNNFMEMAQRDIEARVRRIEACMHAVPVRVARAPASPYYFLTNTLGSQTYWQDSTAALTVKGIEHDAASAPNEVPAADPSAVGSTAFPDCLGRASLVLADGSLRTVYVATAVVLGAQTVTENPGSIPNGQSVLSLQRCILPVAGAAGETAEVYLVRSL